MLLEIAWISSNEFDDESLRWFWANCMLHVDEDGLGWVLSATYDDGCKEAMQLP